MVKHNNVVPNIHGKKKLLQSSRGPIKAKLSLDQASKKKSRRLRRSAKAAAIAPRPLQLLRPAVHCQTQRYSSKVRLGRGFSLAELKAAGLTAAYARTVGIAVDARRTNRSVESLNANVARLNDYKSKLIVFPKRRGIIKAGDSSKEETAGAVVTAVAGISKPESTLETRAITAEEKEYKAFTTMRLARKESKVAGYRVAVVNRKKKD
jgi:large subunit ribosomal protein L13e